MEKEAFCDSIRRLSEKRNLKCRKDLTHQGLWATEPGEDKNSDRQKRFDYRSALNQILKNDFKNMIFGFSIIDKIKIIDNLRFDNMVPSVPITN